MREDIRELNAGVAMSMALAGMPSVFSEGTSVAVGMGNFNSESAVAVGLTRKVRVQARSNLHRHGRCRRVSWRERLS